MHDICISVSGNPVANEVECVVGVWVLAQNFDDTILTVVFDYVGGGTPACADAEY